jgi:hypothetical protein
MKQVNLPVPVGFFIGVMALLGLAEVGYSQGDQPLKVDTLPPGWPSMAPGGADVQGDPTGKPMGEESDEILPYRLIKESSAKIFAADAAQEAAALAYAKARARREAFNQRYQSLLIPRVTFADATFDSALLYLSKQAEGASGSAIKVNMVTLLPPGVAQSRRVSLDISNVPFLDALHYVCEQAGADFTIDTYALVITSKGSRVPGNPATSLGPGQGGVSYLDIPRIVLQQASLGDALDVLKHEVNRVSAGIMPVNFVVHLPPDAKTNPITLDLEEVPLREAIRYVCAEAGVDFAGDPYAITISEPGDEAAANVGTVRPRVAVDGRVSRLVIPEIKIKQASLDESLQFLRQRAAELSGSTVMVNFVVHGQENTEAKPVTLDLTNVPFFAALRYICLQAGAKFAVDTFAIVVSPTPANAGETALKTTAR